MQLTIVKQDNLIIKDGRGIKIELKPFGLPDTFWALQWYDGQGEVEDTDPKTPNEIIDSLEQYQPIIDEFDRLAHLEDNPPPPTPEELFAMKSAEERLWRDHELALTDRCFAPDWGPVGWSDEGRQAGISQLMVYRAHLKAGPNEHPDFPEQGWRPVWPEGVPRPVA